ncbi:hypothetical protein KFK09_022569 [Dendrobium nobile]|uniref:Pentatricopeptide repeat-containing protein n=1 Tax=Dendrobium nobile TaxID=94219 RepID=A0A8T3AQ82_DENNO|nr:hypothetical protein KFK09_022569 [Dendrobium nobile]
MEAFLLGPSTRFRHPITALPKSPTLRAVYTNPSPSFRVGVRCGLRDGPRKPLWRGRVLSKEAIQAVQALKLAKSSPSASANSRTDGDDKMAEVFRGKIARLLKADLLDVLKELQRQNEWGIALQVFTFIKKEAWYKPDLSLYSDMIMMMGKNKLIENAENLFVEIEKEGVLPDTRAFTEIIGAFLQVGNVDKAMHMYNLMKNSGCNPDKLTFTILVRNLEKAGEEDLAISVRRDCKQYIDSPEKFLQELDKEYPKRRSIKLV